MTRYPSTLFGRHLLQIAEGEKKPEVLSGLFSDVYGNVEPHLEQQKAHLQRHLQNNPDFYPELSEHLQADKDIT